MNSPKEYATGRQLPLMEKHIYSDNMLSVANEEAYRANGQ